MLLSLLLVLSMLQLFTIRIVQFRAAFLASARANNSPDEVELWLHLRSREGLLGAVVDRAIEGLQRDLSEGAPSVSERLARRCLSG